MMKTRNLKAIVPFILVPFFLSLVLLVKGKANDFIIERADDSTTLSMVSSSELETLINTVGLRIVVEYANELRYYDLTPIPVELRTMLGQISERIVIQYANANTYYDIDYPIELIGDKQPPTVSTPQVNPVSGGGMQISWSTDEFTIGSVEYGTQSGQYTQKIAEQLYAKEHKIVLTGLTTSETYYYRLSNTDRSNNTTRDQERSFVVMINRLIYLPSVLSNR